MENGSPCRALDRKWQFACFSDLVYLYCNWNIVDLQYYVSFWCTAKWFNYICVCVYIYTHIYSFSIMVCYVILSTVPVLYSKTLFIHSTYILWTATSYSMPPSLPFPLATNYSYVLYIQVTVLWGELGSNGPGLVVATSRPGTPCAMLTQGPVSC